MSEAHIFAQKFNIKKILKFSIPSMFMMVILSMYQTIDGLFVSNFVDINGLGAINIVYPFIFIGLGIALMIGSGGSALIGKFLGEGNTAKANSTFTFLVVFALSIAFLTGVLGSIFINQILLLLGATGNYYEIAKNYLQIHFFFICFYYLQNMFQLFYVTASKPKIGFITTLLAGVTNIVLDYLFIVIMHLGIEGAALATGISYLIPSITGLCYFSFNKKGILHFSKFNIKIKELWKTIVNGSSEMFSNLANAVTTFLFNYQFFKYYSYTGVDSITIVLYFQFFSSSMLFGFASGVAPIVSYKYGKGDKNEICNLKKLLITLIVILSFISFLSSLILIKPVTYIFSGGNKEVIDLILQNYILFSFSLLFMGISIIASSYFTALNDGISSLVISSMRTLIFLSLCLLILPLLFYKNGLWLATSVAELLGALVSICFLIFRKRI